MTLKTAPHLHHWIDHPEREINKEIVDLNDLLDHMELTEHYIKK